MKFLQSFQRSICVHMHRAQPGDFFVGQRKRARKKGAKTGCAHECRQIWTQPFTDEKPRRGCYPGRKIFLRLISNETLGEIPHFWSGSVHLEMRTNERFTENT